MKPDCMSDIETIRKVFDIAGLIYSVNRCRFNRKTHLASASVLISMTGKDNDKIQGDKAAIDFVFDAQGYLLGINSAPTKMRS